jgi:hypothetical protein
VLPAVAQLALQPGFRCHHVPTVLFARVPDTSAGPGTRRLLLDRAPSWTRFRSSRLLISALLSSSPDSALSPRLRSSIAGRKSLYAVGNQGATCANQDELQAPEQRLVERRLLRGLAHEVPAPGWAKRITICGSTGRSTPSC